MAYVIKSSSKNVTTAGTAVQLNSSLTGVKDVLIKAKAANTGKIYVGDSTVDNTGYALSAGETLSVGDIMRTGTDQDIDFSAIYIDSDNNGEGVEYIWGEED